MPQLPSEKYDADHPRGWAWETRKSLTTLPLASAGGVRNTRSWSAATSGPVYFDRSSVNGSASAGIACSRQTPRRSFCIGCVGRERAGLDEDVLRGSRHLRPSRVPSGRRCRPCRPARRQRDRAGDGDRPRVVGDEEPCPSAGVVISDVAERGGRWQGEQQPARRPRRAGSAWPTLRRHALPGQASWRRRLYNPYERPMTSSMISSVPAPMRFSRMSRHTRSTPYSRM